MFSWTIVYNEESDLNGISLRMEIELITAILIDDHRLDRSSWTAMN